MSPLVEITAVGALAKSEGSDRYRPFVNGDQLSVSDEVAQRMVGRGTAKYVDASTADHAEDEQPDSGAIDLEAMTIPELRRFADARRFNLHGARAKPEIVQAIEEALTNPDEDGDG